MARPSKGEKRYYYRCVVPVDMGYIAPSNRREEWSEESGPPPVLHCRHFVPPGIGGKDPNYLVTTQPISKRYVEEVDRIFEKMDPRTGKMQKIKTPSVVKFEEIDPSEFDFVAKQNSRFMNLRDCDLEVSDVEGPIVQKRKLNYEVLKEVENAIETR
jgi:hypothetical protein